MPKHCLVSHRSPASNLKQAGACFPGLGSVFITSVVKLVTRQERRVWRDRRLLAGSPPAFPFYKRLQAFRKKTWASFLFRARFFSVSLQSSFADHRQVDLFCFPVTASALHSSGLGSSAAAQFDLRKEASEFASKQQKHPKKITKQKIQKKKTRTRSSALRVCCPKSGGSTSPHRPNIVPKHLRLRVYTELSISVYCFSRDLPRVTIIIVLKYSRSVAILSFRTRFVPSPSTQRSTLTTVRPTTRPS